MLFFFIPLIFAGIVIISMISIIKGKSNAQITGQPNEQPQTIDQPVQQAAPARPTVQPYDTNVKSSTRTGQTPPIKQTIVKQESIKTVEQTIKAPKREQKTFLTFSGSEAVKGVLYAEILGKPKALR